MSRGSYQPALICRNGHAVNAFTVTSPECNADHCRTCGAAAISRCEHCGAPIKGHHDIPGVCVLGIIYQPPSFCDSCGRPYPWTEAQLQAARDLADELDELSPEDRERLKGSLNDLISDTPRTAVAATIFKKATTKLGVEGGAALKKIVTDIACEAAKKLLFPTP